MRQDEHPIVSSCARALAVLSVIWGGTAWAQTPQSASSHQPLLSEAPPGASWIGGPIGPPPQFDHPPWAAVPEDLKSNLAPQSQPPREEFTPQDSTQSKEIHDPHVQQVDWETENRCECACGCGDRGCYSSYCGHCSDRWRLVPKNNWLDIGGWIDQGVTLNVNSPDDRSNTRVLFNDRSNDYLLNQAYLYASIPVCNDGTHWDLGGRVDLNYGRDSRFVTVPGLERHRDRTAKWNSEDALYGLALPQLYAEIAAPWLNGVSLKAGHFYSTMGYERFAAPDNFFYSHSYSFVYGEPFTFTGALATVKTGEYATFQVGYTRGWDVWDSTSDEWGVLAGVKLATPDKRTSLSFQVHSGDDITPARVDRVYAVDGRTNWTMVFKHCFTDRLRYVFQHDFGLQGDGQAIAQIPTSTISFAAAKWYSINQYLFYEHTSQLTSGLRVEWFRDQDHNRTSVPVAFDPGGPVFNGGNYVAITGGLNWKPHANVILRPELRWDWSDLRGNPNVPGGDPAVRAFVDGKRSSQITAAMDVIVHF